ncbi:hypothetical protein [Arthrobacter mobilis]|uniref:Uncharacterized protein n=1 Tax=Arthrobacter mobilis TaxID=2724944 RepID=A0A7X6K5G0_9MICC|nr:hypothetical protein [Arthrobacter mobilis]NKX54174.1 hypothetical protein [Arthrobacter mobilis]
MTEQNLPDPNLNIQGEDPVIPDEGIDAVPPELVEAGVDTDSERPVDETLSDGLEGGAPSERAGAPQEEFGPDDPDGR